MRSRCFTMAAISAVAARAALTIEEQWGSAAVPKNCFEVLPSFGSIDTGQRVSDWAQLQDTQQMSFQSRISSFKRCFPFNENKLTSLALYLSHDDASAVQGDEEETTEYSLDKIGFEYGDCKLEEVTGEVRWLEIQYTQTEGVQKFTFADEEQTWSFGYEIEGQAKVTKLYEFSDTSRWVGVHGIESSSGIERIGIITMDPTCTPIDGILQPIREDEGEGGEGESSQEGGSTDGQTEGSAEVTEVGTEVVKEAESDGVSTVLIIVIALLAVLVVAAIFLFLFIRKSRLNKAMNRLQTNAGESSMKPNYDNSKKGVIKQDPVKVADVYESNLYSDEENSFKRKSGRTSDQDVNETARAALQEQQNQSTIGQTIIIAGLIEKNGESEVITSAEMPDDNTVNPNNEQTQGEEYLNSPKDSIEYQIQAYNVQPSSSQEEPRQKSPGSKRSKHKHSGSIEKIKQSIESGQELSSAMKAQLIYGKPLSMPKMYTPHGQQKKQFEKQGGVSPYYQRQPVNQVNIQMMNNDIFTGMPPSSSQSIEIPTIITRADGTQQEHGGDTIFEIEKVLKEDTKPDDKNTIDYLMDEMANNAEKGAMDNVSSNIEITSTSFQNQNPTPVTVKEEDQKAIKEIRNIVQTFDGNEIAILLAQVEEELNERKDSTISQLSAGSKIQQLKKLQAKLRKQETESSQYDLVTIDKQLNPDKMDKMLYALSKDAVTRQSPRHSPDARHHYWPQSSSTPFEIPPPKPIQTRQTTRIRQNNQLMRKVSPAMKFRRPEARNNQTEKGGTGLTSSSRLKIRQSQDYQEDEAAISMTENNTRNGQMIKSMDENDVNGRGQSIVTPNDTSSQRLVGNSMNKSRGQTVASQSLRSRSNQRPTIRDQLLSKNQRERKMFIDGVYGQRLNLAHQQQKTLPIVPIDTTGFNQLVSYNNSQADESQASLGGRQSPKMHINTLVNHFREESKQ